MTGIALLIELFFGELLNFTTVAVTLIFTGLLIVVAEKFRRGENVNLLPLVQPSV